MSSDSLNTTDNTFPFPTPADRARWLKQLALFRDVPLDTLTLFAAAMQDHAYPAGTVLCRQGETTNDVFLIVRGDTEIQIDQQGRRVATDLVTAGNCVGEMAALTGQPRSATVLASALETHVVVIPGVQFRNLLVVQPELGIRMLGILGQRMRQSELRRRNAELTDRVDALEQSVAATEAAMRARREFLAAISHELRTPLNGILGLTELVLDTPLANTQREYLHLIRDSGEALLTLINDLLDLSKLEAGRMELEALPFALRDGLGDALKPLAVRAHRKGLELGYRVAADVPESLVGDLARLRQVIVNLVGNAIKFTERGEVLLEVRCVESLDAGVRLQFSVRDTGIGIPKERLNSLFQPYAQADSGIARRFGGTGLGLAISRQLVEQMAGRIWVESDLGQGSLFQFTARFGIGPALDGRIATAATAPCPGSSALVIEPHASTRQTLAAVLREFGYQVESPEVNDSSDSGPLTSPSSRLAPDVVVLSAKAPQAFSLAETYRRRAASLVLLLVTADPPDERRRCEELGFAHLLKPAKPSELWDAIEEAHEHRQNVSVAEATPPTAIDTVGRQILLVEDNLINQRVARSLLEKHGDFVTLAHNGREALAALATHPFDVVLMDVQMPEMDGIEATLAIRRKEADTGRHQPIIAMTAHSLDEEVARCLAAGMDAVLNKPIRPQQLFDVLQSTLGARPPSERSTAQLGTEVLVVDWHAAITKAAGNHQLVAEMAALARAEIPRLLDETTAAIDTGRSADVRLAAHTLKGAVRSLFAQRLIREAERLESLACADQLSDARRVLADIYRETERLLEALRHSPTGRTA